MSSRVKLRSSTRRRSRGRSRLGVIALVVAIAVPAIAALVITSTRSTSGVDKHSRTTGAAEPTNVEISDAETDSDRGPVYRHSVVPGGVRDARDAVQAAASDEVVARHYADVDVAAMWTEVVEKDRVAYVSYRKGEQIYWTNRKVVIRAGETILSNGTDAIRARCGNRLSAVPMQPTSDTDASELELVEYWDEGASSTHGLVSGRQLSPDDLLALAALLPGLHLGLPAAGDSYEVGSIAGDRGMGFLGGYYGSAANSPGNQTESSVGTPPELWLPPNNPILNEYRDRLPDIAMTEVPQDRRQDPTPDSDEETTPPEPPVSVPEPATWFLLGTGVAAVLAKRYRSSRGN